MSKIQIASAMKRFVFLLPIVMFAFSCTQRQQNIEQKSDVDYAQLLSKYAEVDLSADVTHLTEKEKEIIKIFFQVADIMDELFWIQAFGEEKDKFLQSIQDSHALKYALINYGPWDRLNNNEPFLPGYSKKPDGANFYPIDMTKDEFERWDNPDKTSLYTMIRRNEQGQLQAIWYKDFFKEKLTKAIDLLRRAAELAEDPGLKNYLLARAQAFETDNYFESDMLWMDMKQSNIDFVVGPIENYEDKLFGYKAAYEAFILIKDIEWSNRLQRYVKLLPKLQQSLPVDERYKREKPGTESDINVYQAIYYAGDCNAGTKSIAINLPNDEQVQIRKGSRKLQLKNTMKAKFDKILMPIANLLIAPEQRKHVTFEAFFENVLFHEVAHGLGIKNVIGQNTTVRQALKEAYSPIEEAKADIMGLYLVYKLREMGEITEGDLMDNFVTFVAGIFRSVRFGAASAHGKANMMRFNYFLQSGAIERRSDGTYFVHFDKMKDAMIQSVKQILEIQGNGDYDTANKLIETEGNIPEQLQKDLDRINAQKIPVDIVFRQGLQYIKFN